MVLPGVSLFVFVIQRPLKFMIEVNLIRFLICQNFPFKITLQWKDWIQNETFVHAYSVMSN